MDYENCQILLIGESTDHAMEPLKKDQKHGKEEPKEELEKLEHEDELRVKHLHGELFLTLIQAIIDRNQVMTLSSTTSISARKITLKCLPLGSLSLSGVSGPLKA